MSLSIPDSRNPLHNCFSTLITISGPPSSDLLALWVMRMGNEGDPLIISIFIQKWKIEVEKDENRAQSPNKILK